MKKAILSILYAVIGATIGVGATGKVMGRTTRKVQKISDKHLAMFLMMNRWVQLKQEGKNIAEYLEKYDYKTISIYGMGYVGKCLLKELKDSNISIKYGIDKNAEAIYSDIEVFSPDNILENVDVVVVTSIFFMDEIQEVLSAKLSCPIISLEDILYEL